MKKNIFVIFAIAFLSVFCLTACNSKPSVSGEFNQDVYVVSLDETISFFDEMDSLKGVANKDVDFSSSNETILKEEEGGSFKALQSGKTIVFAQYKGKTFAECQVIVKYKFSSPTNLKLAENGQLTWDKSYAVNGSEVLYPSQYRVEYVKLTDETAENLENLEYTSVVVEDNFTFEEKGAYSVKITALGLEEKYVDDSVTTVPQILNYGVMGYLEEVKLEVSEEYSNNLAVLSWKEKENALYDIYINGFKVLSDSAENTFSYDYTLVENEEIISLIITTKDLTGENITTSTELSLQKLIAPNLCYNISSPANYNGIFFWEDVANSSKYAVGINNPISQTMTSEIIEKEEIQEVYFDDLAAGFYEAQFTSIGGQNENGFFLNSNYEEHAYMKFAKLATPNVTVTFEGNKAIFKFEEEYYNERYIIYWADKYEVVSGESCEIDLSDLAVGEYQFVIRAIPKFDEENEIIPYVSGEYSTKVILSSAPFTFDFRILDKIYDVTHSFEENNVSNFSFSSIPDATYYELYINDTLISDSELEEGSTMTFKVQNLQNYLPNDDKYIVRVVAGVRDENHIERAVLSTYEKELSILPIVSQSVDQTNGYFSWNLIEDKPLKYYYEIYKTDSDYVIADEEDIFTSGETYAGQINQPLEFGYYVIRIYTLSEDYNNYLDSSFHDPNNYFTANFLVYKQIESPSVTFSNADGNNKLFITPVEFGGGFEIYVDGELDGSIYLNNSESQQAVYQFKNTFDEEKTYNIQVVATSGQSYDGNLHTDSLPFELTITRLAKPQFEVYEKFGIKNEKTGEILDVNIIENVDHVIIELDGKVVNLDNKNTIDMFDYSSYDDEFLITLKFVAGKAQENNYYLDSFERDVNFKRVPSPTNISFKNGIVSWEADNTNIENYYVSIILTNSTNGDSYYRFYTEDNGLSFDLQGKIDQLLEEDSSFAGNYRLAENVKVELYACKNGFIEDVYYLYSANGTTMEGENTLTVETLQAPKVVFNSGSLIVSWNEVAKNTVYDIYINDELKIEGFTNVSILLSDLGDIDFLTQQKIFIKSENPYYLNSVNSNIIYIKQLAPINSINIAKEQEKLVSFSLSSDLANILEVQVNGNSDNVNYQSTANGGNFNLDNFKGTTSFALQVKAKNTSEIYYYFDSPITTFELVDLSTQEFTFSLNEDILTWDEIVNDFVGTTVNPIVYRIKVTYEGETYTIETTQFDYSIQEIENAIKIKLGDNVSIEIEAVIAQSYTLSFTDGVAKGYYGSKVAQSMDIKKLPKVEDISVEIKDDTTKENMLTQKLNAYALVSWDNIWQDFDNVSFIVTLVSQDGQRNELKVSDGTIAEDYNLSLQEDKYVLSLKGKLLQTGTNTIEVQAIRTNSITSEVTSANIVRLGDVSESTLSDDGVLEIIDDTNSTYLVQLTIADVFVENTYLYQNGQNNKIIDMMVDGLLKDSYGSYTIKVIKYDENNINLPSIKEFTISGTKLQGLQSVEIQDDGYIYLTLHTEDLSSLVLTASTEVAGETHFVQFMPENTELGDNVRKLYINDLLKSFGDVLSMQKGSYTFGFTVNKQGSVRSDFMYLTFNYSIDNEPAKKRGLDFTKDYLIFDILSQDDTVSFNVQVYVFNVETQEYALENIASFAADAVRGYWASDSTTGDSYFVTTEGGNANVDYSPCFGISLNDVLSFKDCGKFYIEVSRLGKTDTTYNVYNYTTLELYKLNKITDDSSTNTLKISGNNLVWEWVPVGDYSIDIQYKATEYYVTFAADAEGDNEVFTIKTYKTSLDLMEAGLTQGKNYNVSVIAVSNDGSVVASDQSEARQVLQYVKPLELAVKNGMLVFNEEKLKATNFMTTITDYFKVADHQESLQAIMGNQLYTEPFYFRPLDLENARMTLRFTLRDETGANTNTYYDITLSAYDLFPDFEIENKIVSVSSKEYESYFSLLDRYKIQITGDEDIAVNTRRMIDALNKSTRGLANDNLLFDKYGEKIPAGEYSVTVFHEGIDGRSVDSPMSNACIIYVSASPKLELKREVINQSNAYTVTFGTAQTYTLDNPEEGTYVKGPARHYQLKFRYATSAVHNFSIEYSDGIGWVITYEYSKGNVNLEDVVKQLDNEETQTFDVISDVDSGDSIPGFKINMTELRKAFEELYDQTLKSEEGEFLIITNTAIEVDLYILSGDSKYVLNGKSSSFNLQYLDLSETSVSFANGEMTIDTGLNDNYSILLGYRTSTINHTTQVYPISTDGEAKIALPYAGYYNYLVFSINGSISYNTMNVESKTYAIENVYKLLTPSMRTQANNLRIEYSGDDYNYYNGKGLEFYLANDVSLQNQVEGVEDEEVGFYYNQQLQRESTQYLLYHVGSANADGKVYETELRASVFSAYLRGNSGTFTVKDATGNESHGADYVWVYALTEDASYEKPYLVFSSEVGTIDAKMLNVIENVRIENGNIKFTATEDLPVIENGEVLYQVEVIYYNEVTGSSEGQETYEEQDRENLYTTNTEIDSQHISQNYDFYVINVTALGAKKLSAEETGCITSIEGNFYSINNSLTYQGETFQVLRSKASILGAPNSQEIIRRTDTPVLTPNTSIINNGVDSGNIIFYVRNEDTTSEPDYAKLQDRITIYATYTRGGQQRSEKVTGSFSFDLTDDSAYIQVIFTPDEGQINDISPMSINIQTYTDNKLISKPLVIENIYKMTNMSENYYEIRLENDVTKIDFTKYLNSVSIAGSRSCYEIVVNYTTTDEQSYEVVYYNNSDGTQSNNVFEITSNIQNIQIKVRDHQQSSTINKILILNSDTLTFNVQQTPVKDENQLSLIDISWDTGNYLFTWNWNNDSLVEDYEYYYEIKIGSNIRSGLVTGNIYMPLDQGLIEYFSIKARKLASEDGDLFTYSESIAFSSQNPIQFNLFSEGNGTKDRPYVISSPEQFYAISRRNTLGQEFYFKLGNNIEIDFAQMIKIVEGEEGQTIEFLIKDFYGHLDGGGYTITLAANNVYDMDEGYSSSINGISGTTTFSKYFALFNSISSNASISNLKISLNIDLDIAEEADINTIIAPLALYNYGQVDGVTINNLKIDTLTVAPEEYSYNIFVGGIVGINYGTIKNSRDDTTFNYDMPIKKHINFAYAGICLFNASERGMNGTIENCYSSGSKSFTIKLNGNIAYGSGITLINNGSINKAGNDSNFTISSSASVTSSQAYFTGISLSSAGGSLSYCYNNGVFTNQSNNVQTSFAGISCLISNGSIRYLVDTKGNALVKSCTNAPADYGVNYAGVGSGTNSKITTTALVATEISCGDDYFLKIQEVSGGFKAVIEM